MKMKWSTLKMPICGSIPPSSEALAYGRDAAEGSAASAVASNAHDTRPSMNFRGGNLLMETLIVAGRRGPRLRWVAWRPKPRRLPREPGDEPERRSR